MCMHDNIKLGDLVSQIHPATFENLKVGIVTDAQKINFDKYFFMEQEDSLFNELNREYLLTSTTIHRRNDELVLKILNSGS